jgi:glycosyltransferase involved in cell wall biosynthesis
LPVSLTIVGEGKMAADLQALIKKLGLHDKVSMPGATVDTESLYASCDVLILPSTSEGLGIVILEAFCHGLPVIGSDVEGINELLRDGRGLLFPNDNHIELAACIRQLQTSKKLQNDLSAVAFAYVRENHDIRVYVQKLFSLYQHALVVMGLSENI